MTLLCTIHDTNDPAATDGLHTGLKVKCKIKKNIRKFCEILLVHMMYYVQYGKYRDRSQLGLDYKVFV